MTKPESPPFQRMIEGHYAKNECQDAIEEILGFYLLGISYDDYDSSIEIYAETDKDIELTVSQVDAILALGCIRFWINFPDGTERYMTSARKPASTFNHWNAFNRGVECKRSLVVERDALLADAARYRWLREANAETPTLMFATKAGMSNVDIRFARHTGGLAEFKYRWTRPADEELDAAIDAARQQCSP